MRNLCFLFFAWRTVDGLLFHFRFAGREGVALALSSLRSCLDYTTFFILDRPGTVLYSLAWVSFVAAMG